MKPERIEENKFVKMVKGMHGEAVKLSTQGYYGKRGFNDRCVFIYPGVVVLFEFKAEGQKPKKLQLYRHRRFKRMLIPCHVVYTARSALEILRKEIRKARGAKRTLENLYKA